MLAAGGYPQRVERDQKFNEAVRNGLIALVAICLVIAVGTFGLVKILGLDGSDTATSEANAPGVPVTPLPTTALPVPGEESSSATPDEEESTDEPGAKGLQISISPVLVGPMECINITGTYRGMDNAQVQVQRKEGGRWTDFPVDATVRAGSFATYVMTGRLGDNKFRVFDPRAGKASNAITVTVQ